MIVKLINKKRNKIRRRRWASGLANTKQREKMKGSVNKSLELENQISPQSYTYVEFGDRTREPEFYGSAEPWITCTYCRKKIKDYPCIYCHAGIAKKKTLVRKRYITEDSNLGMTKKFKYQNRFKNYED